jgi:hypothetical protein
MNYTSCSGRCLENPSFRTLFRELRRAKGRWSAGEEASVARTTPLRKVATGRERRSATNGACKDMLDRARCLKCMGHPPAVFVSILS